MKHLLLAIVATCLVTTSAFGDEPPDWNKIWNQILVTGKLPPVQSAETEQPQLRREGQRVLSPYFAKKYLRGDAWAAWAIEHNKQVIENAERKRSELIITDSGMLILRDSRGLQSAGPSLLIQEDRRKSFYDDRQRSLYDGRRKPPRFWRYQQSGGPVTIYNPYCPPRDVDRDDGGHN